MKSNLTSFSVALLIAGILVNVFYLASLKPDSTLSKWFFDSNVNKKTGCDFYALYLATRNFNHHKSIYEGDPDHKVVPCHYSYRYLPVGVAVGMPFVSLSPKKAYGFWVIFLELLLILDILILLNIAPGPKIFGLGAFGFLAASPLYLELYMGQYSFLQATLMFAAMASLQSKKEMGFNVLWGASLCWKLNTWIAAPALLRQKKWGALAGSLAIIAVTTVPYIIKHPEAGGAILGNFMPDPNTGMTRGNHGLLMLVTLLLDSVDIKTLLVAVPAAVIGLSLLITIAAKKADLTDLICLWMCAYFLAYKHVWEHHYVMLVPVLVILAVRHKSAFLLLPGLLLVLPTVYPLAVSAGWSAPYPILYHGLKPLCALLAYGYCTVKSLSA